MVGTLLYKQAFELFEAGYAAAMGVTMTFFSLLIMLGYRRPATPWMGNLGMSAPAFRRPAKAHRPARDVITRCCCACLHRGRAR